MGAGDQLTIYRRRRVYCDLAGNLLDQDVPIGITKSPMTSSAETEEPMPASANTYKARARQ
jgi:hypothetical protein